MAIVQPRGNFHTIDAQDSRRQQEVRSLNYGGRRCISGINVTRLLVASHIKPWRDCSDEDRPSPRNGLRKSSLHDDAFDSGLITLDEKLNAVLSKRLKRFFPQPPLEQSFVPFEGQRIHLPDKLAAPSQDFLGYHRKEVFQN